MTDIQTYVKMMAMAANRGNDAVTHFGRQMHKERLAHGWSLRELSARTGVDIATLSRVETGKRPPTEKLAMACDAVWPGRRGWFLEYYEESKSWIPAGFRSWAEYEDKAVTVRSWTPGFVDGLLQTEGYARAQLETSPGASEEMVNARLASRMARQKRVLLREEPPLAWFVIDALSLHRRVGSAEVMAAQMRHLAEVAAMDRVTVQVLPAVEHPAGASSFMVTESAAYAEHVAGGFVYTDEEMVTGLARLFDTLRSESDKASESLAMIGRLGETWTGGKAPTLTPTAVSA
jgi:transcriptional regulator with XRE-family HTH domain